MAERRTGLGKGLGALIPPVTDFGNDAAAGVEGAGGGSGGRAGQGRGSGGGARRRRPVDLLFNSSDGPAAPDPAGAQAAPAGRAGGPAPAVGGAGRPAGAARGAGGGSAVQAGGAATGLVVVPGAEFAMLAIDAIEPNPRQPRQAFDEESLRELADSITEVGLLQPVVVRPAPGAGGASDAGAAGDAPAGGGEPPGGSVQRYELVMGERRWRASQMAGLAEVPAIVRGVEDADLLRDALLENLHRSQLNPLEEAAAYRQLMDDFSCTQEELAAKVARSRPQISNTLRLLRLPPLVQRRVAAGVISAGHARALLALEDAAAMERMAQKIVAEGLSVRSTEELVSLGEVPAAAKPRKPVVRPGGQRRALDDLQDRLADRFDTKVVVRLGKAKGKIVIEFASVADLNRIVQVLDPAEPGILK